MGPSRLKRTLTLCAMLLNWIKCVNALICDFAYPDDLLARHALVTCQMDIDYSGPVTAICPSSVDDTNYIWHPQQTVDQDVHLNAYVNENRKFKSVAISDVVRSEAHTPIIWFEPDVSQTKLHLNTSANDLIAITEHRLIFICGPQDFILTEAIQLYLHLNRHRFDGQTQMLTFPWDDSTPLTHQSAHTARGLGVLTLNRLNRHLPLQGCGSRPSPLFSLDSEVTVDPITGVRSCVADPMSKLPIGFVCEGRIEPSDCMRSLIDHNGEVVDAPEPYAYWNFYNSKPWIIAEYFNQLALPPFNGKCWCKDHETDQVKATIEIRAKSEYVCDIANMICLNRWHPVTGPWCSVVLHPGSTLTIKFPVKGVYWDSRSAHCAATSLIHNIPKFTFKTDFFPTDLLRLRQLSSQYDVDAYEEVLYHETLAGDALDLDVSQMFRGEVKLKYHAGKPLALIRGINSFHFNWSLIYKHMALFDMIRAIVNVSFAFTHQYTITGCDREQTNLFDHNFSKDYCYTSSMGNGIGGIYECAFRLKWGSLRAGIRCRQNEELLPNNCDNVAYDLYSNQIVPFPGSLRNVTPYPMQGFKVLDFEFRNENPVIHACVCVDQRGYETSRIILEYDHQKHYTYGINSQSALHTSLPFIWIVWPDTQALVEVPTAPICVKIQDIPQESIAMRVGETLNLHCGIDSAASLQYDPFVLGTDDDDMATIWLPEQTAEFHYAIEPAGDGVGLLRMRYTDSMATSSGSLRITNYTHLTAYKSLRIETIGSAILISKDSVHKDHAPLTFVCGKTLKPSGESATTGNASTSNTSVERNLQVEESPKQYAWSLVHVNIKTTDPYMQGCGVTYESDELFKPETPKIYDENGQEIGCRIDLQAGGEAAFYCPAPYVLDPPNCFNQVYVNGDVTNVNNISNSLVASHSNHFVTLRFDGSQMGPGEALRETPPLECRCVTIKGIVLSTIQIDNYYA
ncbi:hypothetical protein BBBOND_0310290 [Babesia bigemina]|uniref:6-Cys domain-containing protein n=1 Tax=Babesia bigemina TaxID=5866 RepID=A0A061D8T7_BABBI|nr:hypothetical protein BBBOND_0310290 [Babesia bigemina]CDR97126.1 hypothetical protein BBBOND_0310290 [Babesia bigemina]|eukprot:XP_012769312.1 hypothetical protein BBBOND_0310290 [Babesia bigemina]